MAKTVKRIAVTGAGGQIAYNLLFRIASGELFGKDQPIDLHLLEVPRALSSLRGIVMELEDCAFPALKKIRVGSDPLVLFEGVDIAILVGAKPRSAGMERKDLLLENGDIFALQGRALNRVASKNVIVLVVGNPCNTNCLITMHNAPDISRLQFFAMTRLDQNRAQFQLASKAGVDIMDVNCVTILGNHSSTQVPDFLNATIQGKKAPQVILDRKWLEQEFIKTVQKRGGEVIAARGKSSAASAAHAILDSLHSITLPSALGSWYSMGVFSHDNPYGIRDGLIFSFPCQTGGEGKIEIFKGLEWDLFLREKIAQTEAELLDERDMIAHLLQ